MPIRPFLNGEKFDPETTRILVELTCVALRVGDCDDHVKQAIAQRLLRLPRPVNAIPMCCANRC